MTCFKTTLLAATALTMLTGVALAGSNKSYTDQNGDNNRVTVWQDQASNSEIGSLGNAALQDGKGNVLVIDQDDQYQKVGATGGDFLQTGTQNDANVLQQGWNNNLKNTLQTTSEVTSQVRTGTRITFSFSPPFYTRTPIYTTSTTSGSNELDVIQQGRDGEITSVTQTNRTGSGANKATINQLDTARSNLIKAVAQTGKGNTLTLTQGGGWSNVINDVKQIHTDPAGVGNTLTVTQDGGGNVVDTVYQESTRSSAVNSANISFKGYNNGSGNFLIPGFGTGHDLVGTGNDIKQVGGNNVINATFTGDSNLFGFTQDGEGHRITALITGNSNEVAVYQRDQDQVANITVNGHNNDVGISQIAGLTGSGRGNEANVTVNSSYNTAVVNQIGYSNTANITQ